MRPHCCNGSSRRIDSTMCRKIGDSGQQLTIQHGARTTISNLTPVSLVSIGIHAPTPGINAPSPGINATRTNTRFKRTTKRFKRTTKRFKRTTASPSGGPSASSCAVPSASPSGGRSASRSAIPDAPSDVPSVDELGT
jgi:hypothetical protein